jgi:hypothetical protein
VTKDEADVLAIERSFWEAGDAKLFEARLAANGFTLVEPVGVIDKPQAVEMAQKSPPWRDVSFQDVTVRTLAPDTIALAYHGSGTQEGRPEPYQGSILSVYVRTDGTWQLAASAHQPWNPDAKSPNA